MSDDTDLRATPESATDQPADTSRRRFLGGVAVLGVGATLSACGQPGEPGANRRWNTPCPRPNWTRRCRSR